MLSEMFSFSSSCFSTSPVIIPSTGTTTTTSATPSGCCTQLVQTPTSISFGNGDMAFVYNSNTCRQSATVTCS